MRVTFKNNSISGRDYRVKGLHIEIPGLTEITREIPEKIVETVTTLIRRTSPAIQISIQESGDVDIVDEAEESVEEESVESEQEGEVSEGIERDSEASPPSPVRQRTGRGRRKRKQSKIQEGEVIE